MNFAKTNITKFYLIIDSNSYFIRNFTKSEFLYNNETPYLVMHEDKYIKEICSIIGDPNIFEENKKIKNYFKRIGKDYSFLTTPIVFSSQVVKELEKLDSFENLFKISRIEANWHGEFLLHSNIIPFKPCEPFFKCFNYQFEYDFWRKNGELESDIAKEYSGIVIQNIWVKSNIYKNNFMININRKIIRLKHFINIDKTHLEHNFKFYRHLVKDFLKKF